MQAKFEEIINETRPVVIDFHAEWCQPCKMQSPILKEIAEHFGEQVRVIKIDVDQNPALAQKYHIQGVPTVMVFKNGEIRHNQAGVHSKNQLINILTSIL